MTLFYRPKARKIYIINRINGVYNYVEGKTIQAGID